MITLKELIEKPISGDWGTDGDNVNVLRTTNFQNDGVINFDNVVTRNVSDKVVEQKRLLKGDIIIEKSGGSPTQPVGRVVYFNNEGEYICNNFTSILRSKKDLIDSKYLHYILFANHKIGVTEKFQNKTTGIINLQLSRFVENIKIPLPPLETQKHIAQILDDAAALRDKTRQLIREYDALAQSIFLDMFGDPVRNEKGWEKVSLINLCEKIQIGPFGSQLHQADYKDFGIPLINPTNIKNGKVDYSKIAFISEEKYMSLPNYHLQVGDVLMARRGDLSKIGLVIDEKCFCGTGSLFLRPNQKLNPIYAISVLAHKSSIDKLYEKAQGITMANLNKSIISSLEVTVPPIDLQNKFAEKIALIEQQKELVKQELKESEDLFNCLLQKAFKGELV